MKAASKEQYDFLLEYITVFAHAYRMQTHKKITTVEQLFTLMESKDFTFEDVFMVYVEKCMDANADRGDERFWEENIELFGYENYYPTKDKIVNEGAWIKIRTENGFEVHWTKKANRKRRYNEEYDAACKSLIRLTKGQINELSDTSNEKTVAEIITDKVKSKRTALERKISELSMRVVLQLPVYEVKIQRTKSTAEYYLPTQYTIVDDINEFADAYTSGVDGVAVKTLFTSQNKDAVFYMQSRGISKKIAEMLAALKQTYFIINMREAISAYNTNLRKRIRFVTV